MTIESRKAEIVDRIEELKHEIKSFDISEHFDESDFEDYMDECFDDVQVCGYSYSAGSALRELDPIAFREEFNNWLDSKENDEVEEYNEMVEELESLLDELGDIEESEACEE